MAKRWSEHVLDIKTAAVLKNRASGVETGYTYCSYCKKESDMHLKESGDAKSHLVLSMFIMMIVEMFQCK